MIWSIFFFISLISTLLRKTLYLAMSSCKHIIPLKNKIGKSLAFNREVLSTCIFENNNIFEYILYTVFSMVCFFFFLWYAFFNRVLSLLPFNYFPHSFLFVKFSYFLCFFYINLKLCIVFILCISLNG